MNLFCVPLFPSSPGDSCAKSHVKEEIQYPKSGLEEAEDPILDQVVHGCHETPQEAQNGKLSPGSDVFPRGPYLCTIPSRIQQNKGSRKKAETGPV